MVDPPGGGVNDVEGPAWRQRFFAPSLTFPAWASQRPERLVYATNATGAWHVHATVAGVGTTRQVSSGGGSHRHGITPDGQTVAWFCDDDRDEVGRWLAQPFEGGEATPLLDGLEPAWSCGMVLGVGGHVALGTADGSAFTVHVGHLGRPARPVLRQDAWLHVESISGDGALVVLVHAEHGDNLLPALRVVDTSSGETVGELWDGAGCGLYAPVFSPVAGDQRVAFVHDGSGIERPGLWDLTTGERQDLDVDLAGDVELVGWWPDGDALLLTHSHQGGSELHRLDLRTGRREPVPAGTGSPSGALVRPDGQVWFRWSSSASPPTVSVAGGGPVLRPGGATVPPGAPYRPWSFTNPAGQRVHGFYAVPSGEPPHPTVMLVHGGPHQHDTDVWNPAVQAFVDHGWAVALVNYRGSSGYGHDWLHATRGNPGRPEVEDVVAGRDDLVARGIAHRDRVMIAGGSWGGYVTLLAVGTEPEGWRAAVTIAPIADWVTAYSEQSPEVRALARSLFGGSPSDEPALYADRSPITHVEHIRVPVLLLTTDNDTRCPPGQLATFADAMRRAGNSILVEPAGVGHGVYGVEERIAQVRRMLSFGAANVPGTTFPAS